MKNFIITTLAFLATFPLLAQVWVQGNSFIYSKGTDIYIKESLNMQPNARFYLRKAAQLIQNDNVPNTGTGQLSVFQEGAANNFTYNYWGSPVSRIDLAGTGNQGFIHSQINFPRIQLGFQENMFTFPLDNTNLATDLVINSQAATILPTSVRDGLTDEQDITTATVLNPLRIASRWLFKYNNASTGGGTGYASWQPFQTALQFVEPGYGYTMKGVDFNTTGPNLVPQGSFFGQRYDFRGRPNNGTIPLAIVADDFALVGNPYPSALDLKRFLEDNSDYTATTTTPPSGPPVTTYTQTAASQIDAVALFWESKSTSHQLTDYIGGYGSYVPGARGNYSDDGMYIPSAFSRYDSAGNPSNGNVSGGTTVIPYPIGAGTGRRYAPIAQGFMISRTSVANGGVFPVHAPSATPVVNSVGTPQFRNTQRALFRENGTLSFFQAAPGSGSNNPAQTNPGFVRPKIYFSAAVNDLYVREFILAFGDDSTDQLDWGLEATVNANAQVNDMYMPQEGQNLIIKTIPFAETKKVPVGFKITTQSTFEISIKSIQHFNTPFILLHDKQTGTVYDLKTSVAMVTLPVGTYDDRFEIVFQQPSTLSSGSEILATSIDVFQNNGRQELTVNNPQLKDIKNIALYDLSGRMVVSEKTTSRESYSFNTANYSSGIYLVRITDSANSEVTVKVSIAN